MTPALGSAPRAGVTAFVSRAMLHCRTDLSVDPMLDFIERFLGVAPDSNDGSIEFILVVFLIILFAAIAFRLIKNLPA